MADVVQIDYDAMMALAQRVDAQADDVTRMRDRIVRRMDQLQSGGWKGQGASAFYTEMQQEVLPALWRLIDSLRVCADVIRRICHEFEQADQENVRLLGAIGSGDLAFKLAGSRTFKVESAGGKMAGSPDYKVESPAFKVENPAFKLGSRGMDFKVDLGGSDPDFKV